MASLALMLVLAMAAGLAPWVLIGLSTPRRSTPTPSATTRVLRLSGGTVRVEVRGTHDPTVLLLHGFNEGLERWDAVWERLAGCPVRAVRLDLPGFGASDWRDDDFGLPAQATRVVELLDALGLERVTPVGTSMGASLATWLAAKHPSRVARLLLLAPSGHPGSLRHPGLYGRLLEPGRLNAWATGVARTDLFVRLFPRSAAVQALTVSGSYGEPWRRALAEVAAPTVLLWSRADTTASADTAETVTRAIKGSRLVWVVAEAGHGLPSSRPELTASLACQLALGADPTSLIVEPGLLRPGEGRP